MAARFTYAMLKANAAPEVSSGPVEELVALLSQVKSEAVEEAKFSIAQPPKAWLSWEVPCMLIRPPPSLRPAACSDAPFDLRVVQECQRARLRCEQAVKAYDGSDPEERLSLTRSCCLLKILTAIPPVCPILFLFLSCTTSGPVPPTLAMGRIACESTASSSSVAL